MLTVHGSDLVFCCLGCLFLNFLTCLAQTKIVNFWLILSLLLFDTKDPCMIHEFVVPNTNWNLYVQ